MRWPFGPPHMTLKPSKKKHKKNNKPKKTKKEKKKRKIKKKQKILKNELFSYQRKFPSFSGGCPKFPFFDNLAQKARTLKHYKNRGFRPLFFWKADMRHETAIFGPKKPKFINSSYHFFCLFSSLSTTENTKIAETPIFIVF